MTVRVFFPKDVTQILHSLWHAPLALNTGSARQGKGKKTLTVICISFKTPKCYPIKMASWFHWAGPG